MGESKNQEARKASIAINRDILETRYYPSSMATGVLLGIPPIDIVVQNISAKFLTKILQNHDHLRKRVIQQQSSLTFITTQRNMMKQILQSEIH